MDMRKISKPVSLNQITVTDTFWKNEIELVRKEVIPYQWNALNDKVEGAAPSYCMHNFKAAANLNKKIREDRNFQKPTYTFKGFEALPEDPSHPDPDAFYGFVFQDTDFSKWIEAVGYSLTQHPDAELEKTADAAIDIVCAAQQDDGYLDTYYIINGRDKTFSNLKDHHELYCFGHLTEGAIAYYQATGKDKLLKAACRFADYIDSYFGIEEGKCKGYPGHEIAEMALVRLYEVTGETKYYNLAKYFIDQRGQKPYYFDTEVLVEKRDVKEEERYEYYQAHRPVRLQDEAKGHAVRAVYLYSGMTDVARISNDDSLYQACLALWNSVVNEKMYITGGIGATHIGEAFSFPYDLPNDTAYAETCASIGMAFWARRMLQIYPNAQYADVLEREVYNGILSGMALDGKSFFYVNPLEVNPIACHRDERKFHVKPVRQKWFGCACCPPNLARMLSSIGGYAYTETDDTLFVHLFISGCVEKVLKNEKKAKLQISSALPYEGTVKLRVDTEDDDFTLAVRIPGWCDDQFTINGYVGEQKIQDGYLYLKTDWNVHPEVELCFAMDVKAISTDPRVRENIGKVAIVRGPMVYCLEEKDNGAGLHMLSVNTNCLEPAIEPVEICGVKTKGIAVNGYQKVYQQTGPFGDTKQPAKKELRLHYIPYYMWANRGENEMQVFTQAE